MPYGKKSTKRGRGGRGSGRKRAPKRGLSKVERQQVRNIVHGQAEVRERVIDTVGQSVPIAGITGIAPALLKYQPLVYAIGGFNMPPGGDNDHITGTVLNMRSIRLRMLFTLESPHSIVNLPNIQGPRRVLWWVVTLKNNRIPNHSNVNVVHNLGSDTNDFDTFFKRSPTTYGFFQGDRYDELDPINTDVYTCHSKGKFTIGYSENPTTGAKSNYGRVPYMKDLYVPIPKFMFGKTSLVPDSDTETAYNHTNKKCFLVMTTIPLGSAGRDVISEESGIKFDSRLEYKYTDF